MRMALLSDHAPKNFTLKPRNGWVSVVLVVHAGEGIWQVAHLNISALESMIDGMESSPLGGIVESGGWRSQLCGCVCEIFGTYLRSW